MNYIWCHMNIQLTGASLSPFPRRKNMATEICLTIILGHGLEAVISNPEKTGKSYRVHYGTRTFTLYTGKRTWTKEHFFGLNTWKFTERMSWYLVDGYVFLTGKSYIVLIFLDKSSILIQLWGKNFTVRKISWHFSLTFLDEQITRERASVPRSRSASGLCLLAREYPER